MGTLTGSTVDVAPSTRIRVYYPRRPHGRQFKGTFCSPGGAVFPACSFVRLLKNVLRVISLAQTCTKRQLTSHHQHHGDMEARSGFVDVSERETPSNIFSIIPHARDRNATLRLEMDPDRGWVANSPPTQGGPLCPTLQSCPRPTWFSSSFRGHGSYFQGLPHLGATITHRLMSRKTAGEPPLHL